MGEPPRTRTVARHRATVNRPSPLPKRCREDSAADGADPPEPACPGRVAPRYRVSPPACQSRKLTVSTISSICWLTGWPPEWPAAVW